MKNIFLVDIDDTVYDFRGSVNRVLYDYSFKAEMIRRFHEINDMLWRRLEQGKITRDRLVVLRFELLFQEFGIKDNAETVAKKFFCRLGDTMIYLDGAFDFLDELARRGRVFAVTNGSKEIQRKKLSHPRVKSTLSGAFISEEVGFTKPDQRFADFVEKHIPDYQRNRAVWIGDSLTSDMQCAGSCNIDFILFSPDGAPPKYTGRCARSYVEALRIIDIL